MYYLIDFENVPETALEGIETLDTNNKIIIFYSHKHSKISINTHIVLEQSNIPKEYISVKSGGKNALDFQLSTYLGNLIAKNSEESYTVISNDTGFDFVVDFWKERGVSINRTPTIIPSKTTENKPVSPKTVTKKKLSPDIEKTLSQADVNISKITTIINKYKTKQGINNALVKEFGSEKTGVIYKAIKSTLSDKK